MLESGPWSAGVRPDVGGALAFLRYENADVLRSMPEGSRNPLDAACFPLVPYCNRISGARFCCDGRTVVLTPNNPPEAHSLHGLGWQAAWRVREMSGSAVSLEHRHNGQADWPWAYLAEQRIELGPKGCSMTLSVANLAASAMPAGIGFHPYFNRCECTRGRFHTEAVLLCDAELIPTGQRADPDRFARWRKGTALPDRTVDNCHAGWLGQARIETGGKSILLTAENARHLHVYAPRNGAAFCLEPVSNLPDAVNQFPAEMALLEPGTSLSLAMRIAIE